MSALSDEEIRLRCIEAAARNPQVHQGGYAAGVLEMAGAYEAFVRGTAAPTALDRLKGTLGLPKKGL